MVDAYSDVASPDDAGQDVIGRRCVNCRDYVDRLVLLNRWAQQGLLPIPLRRRRRQSVPVLPHRLRAVGGRLRHDEQKVLSRQPETEALLSLKGEVQERQD